MKRLGFNSLFVSLILSIFLHCSLLIYFPINNNTRDEKIEKYEVKLVYFNKPAEQVIKNPKPVKMEKKPSLQAQDKQLSSEADNESTEESIEKFVQHSYSENKPAAPDYSSIFEGLYKRIMAYKIYPNAARRKGLEGIVLISLILDRNGNLLEVNIKQSSGHKVLDRAALSLVKKVVPYEHNLEKDITIEIPVKYNFAN